MLQLTVPPGGALCNYPYQSIRCNPRSLTHCCSVAPPKGVTETHHSPLTTHHSPLTTHHTPLTTHHSPLTTHLKRSHINPTKLTRGTKSAAASCNMCIGSCGLSNPYGFQAMYREIIYNLCGIVNTTNFMALLWGAAYSSKSEFIPNREELRNWRAVYSGLYMHIYIYISVHGLNVTKCSGAINTKEKKANSTQAWMGGSMQCVVTEN